MTLSSQQHVERMRIAIEALPESTRAIYRAHLLHGLDYPAIAELMRLTPRDIERHVAQAIVLIDRALRKPG